ncbi:MAG TPA: hypothetical protein VFP68_18525, partial [Burkholderiaceae bacterium]|nr:hypothetical protein [Burkholderiaceae bacterium]
MKLQWIDDASSTFGGPFAPRSAPWAVPDGWKITDSIEAPMKGKFVVYENSSEKEVMIVAMGTNGNSDLPGWLSNIQSYGKQQWTLKPGVQKSVFEAANEDLKEVEGDHLIVVGDSKGGALAQFIVQTFVDNRNKLLNAEGDSSSTAGPLNKGETALLGVSNANIGLIARVAPGIQDQMQKEHRGWNPQGASYDDIQAFYAAPKLSDGT